MRTSPLPNRHAADLSDFFEVVQATLNRNRSKGDLGDMTTLEILNKTYEELNELSAALLMNARRMQCGIDPTPQEVEHEAADLVVCALSAWLWARRQGKA